MRKKKKKQEIEKSVGCTQFYKAVIQKLQPGITKDQVAHKKSIS